MREREEGLSGPAVCLRAGSRVERPNVLIGVSGNGRYLTRPINQDGLKRLEAWIPREKWRGLVSIRPVLYFKQGPLAAFSSCLPQSQTPTDTLAAVSVTLSYSTTERKTMQK